MTTRQCRHRHDRTWSRTSVRRQGFAPGPAHGELLDHGDLALRLPDIIAFRNGMITNNYGGDPIDLDSAIASTSKCATELASSIRPVENIVTDAVEFDSNVMIVGAYGVLLDLDHGTYPHMTSSNPSVGRTCTGLGTGPGSNGGVVGVFKAYCTRDGVDPFPTENEGDAGDNIREMADEFCVTTDRAQRTRRFDRVAGRYFARVNGFDAMIITRLDTVDGTAKRINPRIAGSARKLRDSDAANPAEPARLVAAR